MTRRLLLLCLTAALLALTAGADGYSNLKLATKSGSSQTVATNGLKIVFNNGNVVATSSNGSATVAINTMDYMVFTNDAGSTETLRGDINGDGNVDVTDVSILIDVILGVVQESDCPGNCNINDDQNIDVTDVSVLIDIVLGKL